MIAEVWETRLRAPAGLTLSVAVIAVLYFLFGRVLGPLTGLAQGLATSRPELRCGCCGRGRRPPGSPMVSTRSPKRWELRARTCD